MKFTVVKSTKGQKGYVNTIEAHVEKTVFGVKKTTKHRFLFKTDEEVPVGTEGDLNLNDYRQQQYQSVVLDENGDEKTITSTWLHEIAKEGKAA